MSALSRPKSRNRRQIRIARTCKGPRSLSVIPKRGHPDMGLTSEVEATRAPLVGAHWNIASLPVLSGDSAASGRLTSDPLNGDLTRLRRRIRMTRNRLARNSSPDIRLVPASGDQREVVSHIRFQTTKATKRIPKKRSLFGSRGRAFWQKTAPR